MFWIIHFFTYSTKHFPLNPILFHFFFNGWEKSLTPSKNFSLQQEWCRKKKEESFMLSTKKTFSFFLGMHILFFTLSNFFVTLFMIIYYLSLYLFVSHVSSFFLCKFVLLFFANLFFHIFVHFFSSLFHSPCVCFHVNIMRVHIWIFCAIFCFWSILFHSLWNFTEFFFRGSKERKSRAREKTMKITRCCWCLDTQVKVMISWFSQTLLTMKITLATPNTTSLRSSSYLSIVPPRNASLKTNVNMYNMKVPYVINYMYPSLSIICCIINRCFLSFNKNSH